jgi:hypothetical protein
MHNTKQIANQASLPPMYGKPCIGAYHIPVTIPWIQTSHIPGKFELTSHQINAIQNKTELNYFQAFIPPFSAL